MNTRLHEIERTAKRYAELEVEWREQGEATRAHGLPWIHWMRGAAEYGRRVEECERLALAEGGW